MEIVKRGTVEADLIWYGVCKSCGSEAIAKQSELTDVTHDQRDGPFSWEQCPVCHRDYDEGMLFTRKDGQ